MNKEKDAILKFHSDTVEMVRKEINLEKPGEIDEAVNLLEEWVKMQKHFLKKDFSRQYLETTLITSKGSLERAKQRIDKLCTFRTLMPEFYTNNIKNESLLKCFMLILDVGYTGFLPTLTKENYRIYYNKIVFEDFDPKLIKYFYKFMVLAAEYSKQHDYNAGFVAIIDLRDTDILNYVSKINLMDLKQFITLMTEGYGVRIKGIHIITESKVVDVFISLLKHALGTKLSGRIQLHKNLDTLYDFIDIDILPVDYGGKEESFKELSVKWVNILCSEDHMEFFLEMNKAKTDESSRQADSFNENYSGMPGSFRVLTID